MQNLEAWVFDHKKIPQYNTFDHNKNSKENHKIEHNNLFQKHLETFLKVFCVAYYPNSAALGRKIPLKALNSLNIKSKC